MSEGASPLAGLTGEQADEAIDTLAAKLAQLEETVKAAKAHLKEMRAARKDLVEPGAADADGVVAEAGAAEGSGRVSG